MSKVLGTGNTLYRSYSYNVSDQILTDNLWQTNTATIGQIQYSYDPSRGWINLINEQQGGRFKEVLGYTKPYYNDSKRNGNIYSQNIYQKNQQGITETKVFNNSYDQYDRLLSSVCSGYPSYSESYQYDMDGNIKLKSGGTKNYQYTYNSGKNTLSGIIDDGQSLLRYSFMYDGKGNMTQKYESTL